MKIKEAPNCPHCGELMKKWRTPADSSWDAEFMYVCFNDECSYFKRGWAWMMEKYEVKTSYRHKIDPVTGAAGPLPVWSATALKGDIID